MTDNNKIIWSIIGTGLTVFVAVYGAAIPFYLHLDSKVDSKFAVIESKIEQLLIQGTKHQEQIAALQNHITILARQPSDGLAQQLPPAIPPQTVVQ